MSLKEAVNTALLRTTGYQLQRPRGHPSRRGRRQRRKDRLLEQPAFILSSVRSGSTLLRVLLNSHSQIHSPPELHLRKLRARARGKPAQKALREIALDEERLRYLLWDRVLHRELQAAGKSILVNKTPNDAFIVDRIVRSWPDARFIYLIRHPASIARSRQKARKQDPPDHNANVVLRYCTAVEEARRAHPGLTVRYEDLATDPARETKRVCEFLGLPWEPEMLDYGRHKHGSFRPGLGDWSDNIKSGTVRPPAPPPSETPPQLVEIARAWGYG